MRKRLDLRGEGRMKDMQKGQKERGKGTRGKRVWEIRISQELAKKIKKQGKPQTGFPRYEILISEIFSDKYNFNAACGAACTCYVDVGADAAGREAIGTFARYGAGGTCLKPYGVYG